MYPGQMPPHPRPSAPVLIVEDDDLVAEVVVDAIGALGYRTIWARNGREALAVLERERPAVMLVDLFMPVMGGSEFLRRVRSVPAWSGIPRVVMTGANDSMIGIKEDAAVLYKPLDIDAVIHLVQMHGERPRRSPAETAVLLAG
jgi:two-component system, OmpR family, response regulator VicR